VTTSPFVPSAKRKEEAWKIWLDIGAGVAHLVTHRDELMLFVAALDAQFAARIEKISADAEAFGAEALRLGEANGGLLQEIEELTGKLDAAQARTQWRCFHCGQIFTDPDDAALHFGRTQMSLAACEIKAGEGGLVAEIRHLEEVIENAHRADDDEDARWAAIHADHAQALVRGPNWRKRARRQTGARLVESGAIG